MRLVSVVNAPKCPTQPLRNIGQAKQTALAGMLGAVILLFSPPISRVEAREILQASLGRVVDGDTLVLRDSSSTRIRLFGIDAPELAQLCTLPQGQYHCGQESKAALEMKIGNAPLACEVRGYDSYRRTVAVCHVLNPGRRPEDLNAWMVQQGWATAYREYSHAYVAQEEAAAAAQLGIWSQGGGFEVPADWRREHTKKRGNSKQTTYAVSSTPVTEPQGDIGCLIKGNVSSRGDKIFHLPGTLTYNATVIDEQKGERWFCSADEAIAAGWRQAKN